MSLQFNGVWSGGLWASTVWAQDVWFEELPKPVTLLVVDFITSQIVFPGMAPPNGKLIQRVKSHSTTMRRVKGTGGVIRVR